MAYWVAMSTKLIEQQLADLQKRVAVLETQRKPRGSWQDLIGWTKEDHLFREAAKLGAAWRAKANRRGH